MDADEYQRQAMATATPNVRGDLAYSMGGVAGEAGEYADLVKKYLYHFKRRPFLEVKEHAKEELGDVLWGVAQAADVWGLTLNEIMEFNLAKLSDRYGSGK